MAAAYPSIPHPTADPANLHDSVLAVKQTLELLTGTAGDKSHAVVTTAAAAATTAAINQTAATNATTAANATAAVAAAVAAIPAHDTQKSDVTRAINAQSGTTYTFVIGDAGALCEFTNAAATTVTIPLNATVAFPIGAQIDVVQGGAGKVTLAGAGGVTLKSVNSFKSLSAQEAGGTLVKMGTDTWRLVGSLIV